MPRVVVLFYLFAALWLLGFGLAAITDGAPAAVACGAVGMLLFLGSTAARIGAQQPPAARRSRTVSGSG